MSETFERQKKFGEPFVEYAADLVYMRPQHFPRRKRVATLIEDLEQATDAVIDRTCVAVRARRYEHLGNYRFDITIRSRSRGPLTEYDKIMAGYGDVFVYLFAGPDNKPPPSRWVMIDLSEFRTAIQSNSILIPKEKPNGDGTAFYHFKCAALLSVPQNIIVEMWDDPRYLDASIHQTKSANLFDAELCKVTHDSFFINRAIDRAVTRATDRMVLKDIYGDEWDR